jgi:glutaredoxin
LESNKVQFKEFNVGEDKAARDEMIKKSGRMVVPVIDIDGEVFVGFDQGALKKKLGIS